ncbi:BON domain-containing protein [Pigmentiphaga humi]|nr:BON domain-containing protein [Pigmentiphaga humi]
MLAAIAAACAGGAPLATAQTVTQDAKQAAQDAKQTARDAKVSASEYASDAMITTKVKAALLKEQTTQSLSIKVTTENRVVHLSGSADTPEQIDSAVRIARGVKDVSDVRNEIQLKKQPQPQS